MSIFKKSPIIHHQKEVCVRLKCHTLILQNFEFDACKPKVTSHMLKSIKAPGISHNCFVQSLY